MALSERGSQRSGLSAPRGDSRLGSRSESAIHDDRSLQENRQLEREAEWDEWQWQEDRQLGMGWAEDD